VRFLVDAQLPPALARWLNDSGEAADHVADLKLLEAGDDELWRTAAELRAVIVSKDEDFALRAQTQSGAQVVWVRLGNVRNVELLRRWAELWPLIREALERGEALVEVI
jgi:predicted nuclease of predicted toxin-antitoxin system